MVSRCRKIQWPNSFCVFSRRVNLRHEQVKFIMGTPILIDPFHNERWEYIYSFQEGGTVREQRHITLHFENDKLAYISGDIEISNIPRQEHKIITE